MFKLLIKNGRKVEELGPEFDSLDAAVEFATEYQWIWIDETGRFWDILVCDPYDMWYGRS